MSEGGKNSRHGIPFQTAYADRAFTQTITGTSQQSALFEDTTTVVIICTDVDTWLRFGANPTAAPLADGVKGRSTFHPANLNRSYNVKEGGDWRVAFIKDSGPNGQVFISEAALEIEIS